MRIGLVYDVFDAYPWQPGEAADADAEYEPPETVEALADAVRALGHTPVAIGTAHDLLEHVHALEIDAALTIAEGARSRNREAYAPILLEMTGIPCLGADALTLSLSLDKAWTKDLAAAAGIPTPAYRVYADEKAIDKSDLPGPYPLFVKPRYEGSAKGIQASSRVANLRALRAEVKRQTRLYGQDVIVEAFVEGSEFTVAVVGHDPPRALPVLQRAVEPTTGIGLHALEHRGMPEQELEWALPGQLTPELEAELQRQALVVFDKLECRDFSRADFRVDADGGVWFLETNTLPTFAPDGTFAILAELVGKSYPDFLAEVLGDALRRVGVG